MVSNIFDYHIVLFKHQFLINWIESCFWIYLLLTFPNDPFPKFFEKRYWPILISLIDYILLLKYG